MSKNREIKTAILVLSSIFFFIWGYSFIKSRDLFKSSKTFYVVYDNVDGLLPNAMVTLKGLSVGSVESIQFLNEKGQLLVTLIVETDFPISKKSIAQIYEPGLIAGKQIAIVPDFNDKKMAISGDTLKSNVVPSLVDNFQKELMPLKQKLESAITSADSLIKNFNTVLNDKNKAEINKSLQNLSQTLANVNSMAKSADGLITGNKPKLDNAIKNLDVTVSNFSKISDTLVKANLGKTVEALNQTLASTKAIMADLEKGKGTAGKLLKDEAMYNNLAQASKELELLLADIKNNPKRYIHISIFGKTPKPYQNPNQPTNK